MNLFPRVRRGGGSSRSSSDPSCNGDRVPAALAAAGLPLGEVRARAPPAARRPLQRRRRGYGGDGGGRDGGGAAAGERDQGEEGRETAGLAHEAGREVHEELSIALRATSFIP